jgi:cyclopropane fatty-acyl-phospholipid synthase-like methyltransferase
VPWTPEDWEGLLEPESQPTRPAAPIQALADILQRIPDRAPMSVADFGCRSHPCLSLLATGFGKVLAVAESEIDLAAARKSCPDDNVRYAVCDFTDLTRFAGSMDVVVAMDVPRLLQGAPIDAFIEGLHGCLVEGGILLMSVPAAKRMGGPVELHLGKRPGDHKRTCYHEVELQYRIRRAGFQGLRIRRFEAADDRTGTLLCMAVRRAIN